MITWVISLILKWTSLFTILIVLITIILPLFFYFFYIHPLLGVFFGLIVFVIVFVYLKSRLKSRHRNKLFANSDKIFKTPGLFGFIRWYDDSILKDRLEKYADYRHGLSKDKIHMNLNKSIYKLEKEIRKSYKNSKYQDALDLTQQIFKMVKEEYDLSHPFFTLTITNLGKLYQEIGNYTEARSHLEKALEIRQKLLGENNLHVALTMTHIGKLYQEIGNYTEARSHLEKALEIRQKLLGENNLHVALTMTHLGKLYQEMGKYSEAESLFERSIEIMENLFGRNHIYLAISYTDFGYLYYEKGEYDRAGGEHDKATEYYNYAMEIWRYNLNYKTYPLDAIVTINNLGLLYQEMGKFQEAEKYLKNGLEIRQKLLGENHPIVAQSMTNLGKLYHEMGDYNKAELLYEKSLNILPSSMGKDNIYFANLLTYRGKLYHDQVNYSQAEALHKKSLEILEKLLDANQLHIAQSMTNLGKLYHEIGNYREAESYLKKALKILENIFGESHLHISQSKRYLAEVYMNIGDYTKADEYYTQALEIRLKILSRFKNTADRLLDLGGINQQLGKKTEAIRLYKKSLDSWKKIGGKKSSGYATALNKLGELYYDLGDFSKSEEYYKEALEVRKLIFSHTSPPIAQSMDNLAILLHQNHEYGQAEEYYKQALKIWRSVFGEKNINIAITLKNLALLYAKTNRQDKAIDLMKDVITFEDELIGQVFSIGSERQRMTFLNVINKNFHNFLSLTNQYFSNSKEEVKYALNLVIRRKGIGAEALTATRDAVLSGKYPEMESKLRELNILRKQIARKVLDGKDENETLEKHNQILAEWNNRKENLEADLANKIPEIGLEQKLKTSNLERIIQVLPRESILIEFVKFDYTDFSNQNNNDNENKEISHYLAFIIYDNITNNDIQMIDLGDSELIDDKINKFRNAITGENQNRNLIPVDSSIKSSWSNSTVIDDLRIVLNPLLKAIENHKRVFIAPDGDFTKFPFELLQFDSSNRYILEDYLVSYITTARDLIAFDNFSIRIETFNKSLVIADPDFDLTIPTISSNKILGNSTSAYTEPAIHFQDNKTFYRHSRDLDPRSLNFNRLKGTREEGQIVADLIGVTPYMDQKVLEEEIKSYSSPNIIHIATHGFFLANQKKIDNNELTHLRIESTSLGRLSGDHLDNPMLRSDDAPAGGNTWLKNFFLPVHKKINGNKLTHLRIESTSLGRLSGDHLDNPMLRSGLALAGVNTWLKNGSLIKEAEDGILTAEDVAGWDLSKTEMVVLSACETGLGDIVTGEGVFGLRRAFVLAGAQTLVMSLWKVPDKQTKELMVEFYKLLLSGKPRAEALREAQLAMKKKYLDPYYWGAFICQGNPYALSKHVSQN